MGDSTLILKALITGLQWALETYDQSFCHWQTCIRLLNWLMARLAGRVGTSSPAVHFGVPCITWNESSTCTHLRIPAVSSDEDESFLRVIGPHIIGRNMCTNKAAFYEFYRLFSFDSFFKYGVFIEIFFHRIFFPMFSNCSRFFPQFHRLT